MGWIYRPHPGSGVDPISEDFIHHEIPQRFETNVCLREVACNILRHGRNSALSGIYIWDV